MEITIESISPGMAEKYLQFNTCNRSIRQSLVSQYARDMVNGNWKLTHQGVAFNCDGTLLDGQHRLRAIVQSGVTVQMVVARGVDSKNQLFMDDHAKRTVADALSLIRGDHVTRDEVAIVRAAVELQEGFVHRTRAELNELVDEFREPIQFALSFASKKSRGVTSAPVLGAIMLAWHYVDDLERLSLFCRIVCGSEMALSESDVAAQLLREWLLRHGAKHGSQRSEAFRKSQRAIVAFMKHQKLDKIYGTAIHYPYPLVDPVRRGSSSNTVDEIK